MSRAQEILDKATGQFKGQEVKPEKLKEMMKKRAEQSGKEMQAEAAAFTEEIVKWLNDAWNEREFTAIQRVYSLALAYTNFQKSYPEDKGGPKEFDEIAAAAIEYYRENAGK